MRPGPIPPCGPRPPRVSSLALQLPDVGHSSGGRGSWSGICTSPCLSGPQFPQGHPTKSPCRWSWVRGAHSTQCRTGRQQGPAAPRRACAVSEDGAQGQAESVGVATAPTSSLQPAGWALCSGLTLPPGLPMPSAVPHRVAGPGPPSPCQASGLPRGSSHVQPPLAVVHTGLGFATCGLGFRTPQIHQGSPLRPVHPVPKWPAPVPPPQATVDRGPKATELLTRLATSLGGSISQAPRERNPLFQNGLGEILASTPLSSLLSGWLPASPCPAYPQRAGHRERPQGFKLLRPGQLCSPPGRT